MARHFSLMHRSSKRNNPKYSFVDLPQVFSIRNRRRLANRNFTITMSLTTVGFESAVTQGLFSGHLGGPAGFEFLKVHVSVPVLFFIALTHPYDQGRLLHSISESNNIASICALL